MCNETQNKESQSAMTIKEALQRLKDGNQRFVDQFMCTRNYREQVRLTGGGQAPFAAVLGCIDSRVPIEMVFDQGIGDIFSARVAGNVADADVLGSLEYAVQYAGSKLIVVLGHTSCGAVGAAFGESKKAPDASDRITDANLVKLLSKITPAVAATEQGDNDNATHINNIVETNVRMTIANMLKDSETIAKRYNDGKIDIVGAVYDVKTGSVAFLDTLVVA